MLDERFVIIGAIIGSIGAVGYLIDTLKGKTKPNKVTWLLWAAAPLIAFSAEVKQGVGLRSLMTFTVGFNPLIIFLASFLNKKAQWKISKLDITCGLLSILGLLLWYLTKVGNTAILFSIFADGLAAVPTIVKSYNRPETESSNVYISAAINSIITILTIKTWRFAFYAFPIYIFAVDAILVLLIQFKLGLRIQKKLQ